MKARSIEIDGETYSVCRCADCPCYDGGDNGYGERCKHPKGDGKCAEVGGWSKEDCEFGQYNPKAEDVFGPSCPLKDGEADEDDETVAVCIKLTPKTRDMAKRIASERGTTMSALIESLITGVM